MIHRRSFLLGLGGLVTASFATRARAFAKAEGTPLLLVPQAPEKTFHLFAVPVDDASDNKWRISLGSWEQEPPPAPTWREYLRMHGHRLDTKEHVATVLREKGLEPHELDEPLPQESWWSAWEYSESPQARAYRILHDLDLGCSLNGRGRKAGRIDFVEGGWHPGSNERWAELRDDLTVSLLQARMIELGQPIRIVIDE